MPAPPKLIGIHLSNKAQMHPALCGSPAGLVRKRVLVAQALPHNERGAWWAPYYQVRVLLLDFLPCPPPILGFGEIPGPAGRVVDQ
eukprot:7875060-Lingulodinium_polyedra.AAC.1